MGLCNVLKVLAVIVTVVLVVTAIHYINLAKPKKPQSLSMISNNSWTIRTFPTDNFHPIPLLNPKTERITYVTGSHDPWYTVIVSTTADVVCSVHVYMRYNSESSRSAISLGNGKIVEIILNNQVSRDDPIDAAIKVDWRLVIVDENHGCNHVNKTIASTGWRFVQAIPYEDTFDVLMKNTMSTSINDIKISRYNDKGEKLTDSWIIRDDEHISKIIPAKKYDPNQGYYYVVPSGVGLSLIKKLNSNYKLIGSYEFEHSKYDLYDNNAFSAEHDRFSVCHFDKENGNRMNLKCLILNAELTEKIAEVPLTFDHVVEHVNVNNYADGKVLVVYSRKRSSEDKVYQLYAQLVAKTGKIGGPVELGEIPNIISDVYSFEMKDGTYCLAVTTDKQVMTKCLDLPK